MERCPQCNEMTAETNHNTGTLICYSKTCNYTAPSREDDRLIAEALGLKYEPYYSKIPNYFSLPDGFFTIMELGPGRDWWLKFIDWLWKKYISKDNVTWLPGFLIEYANKERMKSALVEFLRKEQ